jgi:alkyl sulfatase BDS1-like metallo-beta-lactamase superfamily hydrolase
MDHFLKTMAVRVNPERAATLALTLSVEFEDIAERWQLTLSNAVLHSWRNRAADSDLVLQGDSFAFKQLLLGQVELGSVLEDGRLRLAGDPSPLQTLAGLFDSFDRRFPIVTPRA